MGEELTGPGTAGRHGFCPVPCVPVATTLQPAAFIAVIILNRGKDTPNLLGYGKPTVLLRAGTRTFT